MKSPDPEQVAVLYSGGTDSTLTACIAAERYRTVHLLTYRRLGMFNVDHADHNVAALRGQFGPERFVRPAIMPVDSLFRHVSYHGYLRSLRRHGFAVLTTCGQCKLAMHLRTLAYCLEQGVGVVQDGANQAMSIFPMQMAPVLELMHRLYAEVGIRYENPVFDYEDDQGIEFGSFLWGLAPSRGQATGRQARTTGAALHAMGLSPEADVKGTAYDKQIQARCYQFALFNLWARWYALERGDMAAYRRQVMAYYTERIAEARGLVQSWQAQPEGSRFARLLERG